MGAAEVIASIPPVHFLGALEMLQGENALLRMPIQAWYLAYTLKLLSVSRGVSGHLFGHSVLNLDTLFYLAYIVSEQFVHTSTFLICSKF